MKSKQTNSVRTNNTICTNRIESLVIRVLEATQAVKPPYTIFRGVNNKYGRFKVKQHT